MSESREPRPWNSLASRSVTGSHDLLGFNVDGSGSISRRSNHSNSGSHTDIIISIDNPDSDDDMRASVNAGPVAAHGGSGTSAPTQRRGSLSVEKTHFDECFNTSVTDMESITRRVLYSNNSNHSSAAGASRTAAPAPNRSDAHHRIRDNVRSNNANTNHANFVVDSSSAPGAAPALTTSPPREAHSAPSAPLDLALEHSESFSRSAGSKNINSSNDSGHLCGALRLNFPRRDADTDADAVARESDHRGGHGRTRGAVATHTSNHAAAAAEVGVSTSSDAPEHEGGVSEDDGEGDVWSKFLESESDNDSLDSFMDLPLDTGVACGFSGEYSDDDEAPWAGNHHGSTSNNGGADGACAGVADTVVKTRLPCGGAVESDSNINVPSMEGVLEFDRSVTDTQFNAGRVAIPFAAPRSHTQYPGGTDNCGSSPGRGGGGSGVGPNRQISTNSAMSDLVMIRVDSNECDNGGNDDDSITYSHSCSEDMLHSIYGGGALGPPARLHRLFGAGAGGSSGGRSSVPQPSASSRVTSVVGTSTGALAESPPLSRGVSRRFLPPQSSTPTNGAATTSAAMGSPGAAARIGDSGRIDSVRSNSDAFSLLNRPAAAAAAAAAADDDDDDAPPFMRQRQSVAPSSLQQREGRVAPIDSTVAAAAEAEDEDCPFGPRVSANFHAPPAAADAATITVATITTTTTTAAGESAGTEEPSGELVNVILPSPEDADLLDDVPLPAACRRGGNAEGDGDVGGDVDGPAPLPLPSEDVMRASLKTPTLTPSSLTSAEKTGTPQESTGSEKEGGEPTTKVEHRMEENNVLNQSEPPAATATASPTTSDAPLESALPLEHVDGKGTAPRATPVSPLGRDASPPSSPSHSGGVSNTPSQRQPTTATTTDSPTGSGGGSSRRSHHLQYRALMRNLLMPFVLVCLIADTTLGAAAALRRMYSHEVSAATVERESAREALTSTISFFRAHATSEMMTIVQQVTLAGGPRAAEGRCAMWLSQIVSAVSVDASTDLRNETWKFGVQGGMQIHAGAGEDAAVTANPITCGDAGLDDMALPAAPIAQATERPCSPLVYAFDLVRHPQMPFSPLLLRLRLGTQQCSTSSSPLLSSASAAAQTASTTSVAVQLTTPLGPWLSHFRKHRAQWTRAFHGDDGVQASNSDPDAMDWRLCLDPQHCSGVDSVHMAAIAIEPSLWSNAAPSSLSSSPPPPPLVYVAITGAPAKAADLPQSASRAWLCAPLLALLLHKAWAATVAAVLMHSSVTIFMLPLESLLLRLRRTSRLVASLRSNRPAAGPSTSPSDDTRKVGSAAFASNGQTLPTSSTTTENPGHGHVDGEDEDVKDTNESSKTAVSTDTPDDVEQYFMERQRRWGWWRPPLALVETTRIEGLCEEVCSSLEYLGQYLPERTEPDVLKSSAAGPSPVQRNSSSSTKGSSDAIQDDSTLTGATHGNDDVEEQYPLGTQRIHDVHYSRRGVPPLKAQTTTATAAQHARLSGPVTTKVPRTLPTSSVAAPTLPVVLSAKGSLTVPPTPPALNTPTKVFCTLLFIYIDLDYRDIPDIQRTRTQAGSISSQSNNPRSTSVGKPVSTRSPEDRNDFYMDDGNNAFGGGYGTTRRAGQRSNSNEILRSNVYKRVMPILMEKCAEYGAYLDVFTPESVRAIFSNDPSINPNTGGASNTTSENNKPLNDAYSMDSDGGASCANPSQAPPPSPPRPVDHAVRAVRCAIAIVEELSKVRVAVRVHEPESGTTSQGSKPSGAATATPPNGASGGNSSSTSSPTERGENPSSSSGPDGSKSGSKSGSSGAAGPQEISPMEFITLAIDSRMHFAARCGFATPAVSQLSSRSGDPRSSLGMPSRAGSMGSLGFSLSTSIASGSVRGYDRTSAGASRLTVWGPPLVELLFKYQQLIGLHLVLTETVAPLVRGDFRVLPIDTVYVDRVTGDGGTSKCVIYAVIPPPPPLPTPTPDGVTDPTTLPVAYVRSASPTGTTDTVSSGTATLVTTPTECVPPRFHAAAASNGREGRTASVGAAAGTATAAVSSATSRSSSNTTPTAATAAAFENARGDVLPPSVVAVPMSRGGSWEVFAHQFERAFSLFCAGRYREAASILARIERSRFFPLYGVTITSCCEELVLLREGRALPHKELVRQVHELNVSLSTRLLDMVPTVRLPYGSMMAVFGQFQQYRREILIGPTAFTDEFNSDHHNAAGETGRRKAGSTSNRAGNPFTADDSDAAATSASDSRSQQDSFPGMLVWGNGADRPSASHPRSGPVSVAQTVTPHHSVTHDPTSPASGFLHHASSGQGTASAPGSRSRRAQDSRGNRAWRSGSFGGGSDAHHMFDDCEHNNNNDNVNEGSVLGRSHFSVDTDNGSDGGADSEDALVPRDAAVDTEPTLPLSYMDTQQIRWYRALCQGGSIFSEARPPQHRGTPPTVTGGTNLSDLRLLPGTPEGRTLAAALAANQLGTDGGGDGLFHFTEADSVSRKQFLTISDTGTLAITINCDLERILSVRPYARGPADGDEAAAGDEPDGGAPLISAAQSPSGCTSPARAVSSTSFLGASTGGGESVDGSHSSAGAVRPTVLYVPRPDSRDVALHACGDSSHCPSPRGWGSGSFSSGYGNRGDVGGSSSGGGSFATRSYAGNHASQNRHPRPLSSSGTTAATAAAATATNNSSSISATGDAARRQEVSRQRAEALLRYVAGALEEHTSASVDRYAHENIVLTIGASVVHHLVPLPPPGASSVQQQQQRQSEEQPQPSFSPTSLSSPLVGLAGSPPDARGSSGDFCQDPRRSGASQPEREHSYWSHVPLSVFFVTEYVPCGTLRSVLENFPTPLPLPTVYRYTLSILRGLDFLHTEQRTLHGFLCPDNVMIESGNSSTAPDRHCKLRGMLFWYNWAEALRARGRRLRLPVHDPNGGGPSFEEVTVDVNSRVVQEEVVVSQACYHAPEVTAVHGEYPSVVDMYNHHVRRTEADGSSGGERFFPSDIFSLGLIVLELLSGRPAWRAVRRGAGETARQTDYNYVYAADGDEERHGEEKDECSISGDTDDTSSCRDSCGGGDDEELRRALSDSATFAAAYNSGRLELRPYKRRYRSGNNTTDHSNVPTAAPSPLLAPQRRSATDQPLPADGAFSRATTATAAAAAADGKDDEAAALEEVLVRVMEGCLCMDPAARKTAADLLDLVSNA